MLHNLDRVSEFKDDFSNFFAILKRAFKKQLFFCPKQVAKKLQPLREFSIKFVQF